jgi:putative ABC transport system permease protein
MNALQLFITCFRSIFRNKMRSLLTSLGIIIGVASVIIMTAIGLGAQKAIEDRISAMGTNLLQVTPARPIFRSGDQLGRARPMRITMRDAEKLAAENSYAEAVSGIVQRSFTCVSSLGSTSVQTMGVSESYLDIREWKLAAGDMFEGVDNENKQRLAVLGWTTAETLFGTADAALDQKIRINQSSWTVIGILEYKGTDGGMTEQDDVIIVPIKTFLSRLAYSQSLNTIALKVVDKKYMEAAQREVEAIVRESHKIQDGATADFQVFNSASLIEAINATTRNMTILLAAIAGVSLLVGGIGIMNIMLVSVTERTREIGIRMAVGAHTGDILLQFLAESCVLSLIGGIIGIALSFGAVRVLALFKIPATISIVIVIISATFSAFIGILFGYYPAKKASNLYPIEALLFE